MPLFPHSDNLNHKTYKDQVTSVLRDAILKGRLEPNTPLIASQLSQELGISRGPVREALTQLQHEGLVTHSSHRTPRVTSLEPYDAWEVYTLRASLEMLALKLGYAFRSEQELKDMVADLDEITSEMQELQTDWDLPNAVQLDLRFHSRLCSIGTHSRLKNAHGNLDALVGALFLSIRKNFNRSPRHMHDRHHELMEALKLSLKENDPEIAEEAIWRHHNERAEEFLGLLDDRRTGDS